MSDIISELIASTKALVEAEIKEAASRVSRGEHRIYKPSVSVYCAEAAMEAMARDAVAISPVITIEVEVSASRDYEARSSALKPLVMAVVALLSRKRVHPDAGEFVPVDFRETAAPKGSETSLIAVLRFRTQFAIRTDSLAEKAGALLEIGIELIQPDKDEPDAEGLVELNP